MATQKNVEDFTNSFQEVTVKIVSPRGHDEQVVTANVALDVIKEQCADHGKWVYVDGQHRDPNALTIDMLVHAEDITLTNGLRGGN